VGDFVIEAEQFADHAAVDDLVRRAFAHHPEVADMVAAIRVSPRYRPGLAFVARVGHRVRVS
jgi:predicted N-acetyltransferase YhbS